MLVSSSSSIGYPVATDSQIVLESSCQAGDEERSHSIRCSPFSKPPRPLAIATAKDDFVTTPLKTKSRRRDTLVDHLAR
jgi:hypothetical protein